MPPWTVAQVDMQGAFFLKLLNAEATCCCCIDWCRLPPSARCSHQGPRLGGVLNHHNQSETAPLMPLSGTLAASADSRLAQRPVPVFCRDWRDGWPLRLRLSWTDLLRPFTSGRWEHPCWDCSSGIEQWVPALSRIRDVQH